MKSCWNDKILTKTVAGISSISGVFFVFRLRLFVYIDQNPSLERKIPKRTQPFETRPAVHMFFMLKLKLPNDYSHWGWMVGWLETLEKKPSRTSMKSLIMTSLNSKTTGLKKPLGNVLFLTESRGFDLFFVADQGTCPRSFADRVSVFVFMTLQKRAAKRDSFPAIRLYWFAIRNECSHQEPTSHSVCDAKPCGFEFRVHRINSWLYRLKNKVSITCPNSESFQMNSKDLPRLKWTCPFHVGRVVRLLLDLKQCETRGHLNDWSGGVTWLWSHQLGVVYIFPGWNMYPNKNEGESLRHREFPRIEMMTCFPRKSWTFAPLKSPWFDSWNQLVLGVLG